MNTQDSGCAINLSGSSGGGGGGGGGGAAFENGTTLNQGGVPLYVLYLHNQL